MTERSETMFGTVTDDRELVRLGDLLEMPEETTRWVVEGMLPSGGFSLIAAKPKVGKSTLAQTLALCVARGDDFLGRKTAQGPTIYYAIEEKAQEVRRQFLAMGGTGDDSIRLLFGSMGNSALDRIERDIRKYNPRLVIIDPLFRAIKVSDANGENSYIGTTKALEPLLMLAREMDAHIVCTHHEGKMGGKGGDGVLGSTAIFGSVDALIKISKNGQRRTISTTQRYGEDLEKTSIVLRQGIVTLGEWRETKGLSNKKDEILDFLRKQKEAATKDVILSSVKGHRQTMLQAINELLAEGRIFKSGCGRPGSPFEYSTSSLVPTSSYKEKGTEPDIEELYPACCSVAG